MKNAITRLAVCLVLVAGITANADAANKDRIGTAAAQELLIPVGARGLAVGGSYMVFATGVDAIYYNPAGLSDQTSSVEALASSMNYIADIGVVYGALGIKAGDLGTLGFSLKSINFGDIPVTTTEFPDGNGQSFSPTYITVGATYAKALTDRISVGVTASLVTERIQDVSATGAAFNFGIQYHNLGVEGLDLALAVKNIGPNMSFAGSSLLVTANATTGLRGNQFYSINAASSEMPSLMEIGLAYRKKLDDMNSVNIGGLFRNNNYQDDEYNFGGEYIFNDLFFLRGGYTFAPQADKDPTGANSYLYDYTVGAGVHYPLEGLDLSLDYAYRHMKYFTGNNIITVKIGF